MEYMFFISLRSYHMLLLSCRLHNLQPHQPARVAMRKSARNLIFIAVTHPFTRFLNLYLTYEIAHPKKSFKAETTL
jgi:hypothetical protein